MKAFCKWCDDEFTATSSRQIYCSPDCRKAASKEKIVERQLISKRIKRQTRKRMCAGGCNTPLSIYNDTGMCDNCLVHKRKMAEFMRDLKEYFDYN